MNSCILMMCYIEWEILKKLGDSTILQFMVRYAVCNLHIYISLPSHCPG
jgi:hypothetical protein